MAGKDGCLVGCFVVWLDGSSSRLVGRVVGWLVGTVVGWWAGGLVGGWVVGWPGGWLVGRLGDGWLVGR